MVNPDIVGGLKSALSRGYTLEEAMLSFLNGGYKKEEIEEAAQSLQAQVTTSSAASDWSPQPIWARQKIQPPLLSKNSKKVIIGKPAPPKQAVTKGVAAYTNYNPKLRTATIILIILLVILLGALGLMYVFKEQIIDFFNNLF